MNIPSGELTQKIPGGNVVHLVAPGLASLAGSRSTIVGILLAWQVAVTSLALAASNLGTLREGLLTAGLDRRIPAGLLPGARPDPVNAIMAITLTAAVITGWRCSHSPPEPGPPVLATPDTHPTRTCATSRARGPGGLGHAFLSAP